MSILIASPSEEFADRLHRAYGARANGNSRYWRNGLSIAELPSLAADMVRAEPEVVVVGPEMPTDAALALLRACDEQRPDVVTVLVAEPAPELWPAAMRAGARDILSPDLSDVALKEAIDRALQTAQHLRSRTQGGGVGSPRARVIAIVSPKGGVGKTTVATNLSYGLSRAAPGEVVLIDLDLQFGGVAGALRLTPAHSIADAASAGSALDSGTLKMFLRSHPSGLYALCAPDSLAQADDVNEQQLSTIVSLLSDDFRYVVIDTAAGIDVVTLAAIELATDLVLVSTTDVACVRALRRATDAIDAVGLSSQVRHVVLNRADARSGLTLEDVQRLIEAQIDVSIPESREVALSLNLGVPILESEPRSAPARAFAELVGPFLRAEAHAVPSGDPRRGRRLHRRRKDRS